MTNTIHFIHLNYWKNIIGGKVVINVVIPMAGAGSRFLDAGYKIPKPFIDVLAQPMISRVMDNLSLKDASFYLIARKEHLIKEYKIVQQLSEQYKVKFIEVDDLTEGTVCTVLFARKFINNDTPLMIANSDQLVDIDISDYVNDCAGRGLDGSIMTFHESSGDKSYSYARTDENGMVKEVKEKEAISEHATVGIYLYSKGADFVNAAVDMIIAKDKTNNEYYTCPTYNYLISEGLNIGTYDIDASQMHVLGTPEALNQYIDFFK